jgi:CelD/BcsL family acetyltransferase involved in cellulose biosynthesis
LNTATITFRDFLASRHAWNTALEESQENHIFLTWEWLSTWWKHFGSQNREFLMITVNDDGKILAAAPLMNTQYKLWGLTLRKIEFLATPASDYHSLLLTEKGSEYAKLMLEYALRRAKGWDCLELREIPNNSATAKALREATGKGLNLAENARSLCRYVPLSRNFESYFSHLRPQFRRNFRRAQKKLRRDFKVSYQIHCESESVNHNLKIFIDLHQKRWRAQKQSGVFADRTFRNFHIDVAKSFAKKGWLALFFLLLDDEPVAATYCFRYASKLYGYLSGHDPQYSEYGVGNLLLLHMIKNSIEEGLFEVDFMRGDEPYKKRWNARVRKNIQARIMSRGIMPSLYDWITRNDVFNSITYELGRKLSAT